MYSLPDRTALFWPLKLFPAFDHVNSYFLSQLSDEFVTRMTMG